MYLTDVNRNEIHRTTLSVEHPDQIYSKFIQQFQLWNMRTHIHDFATLQFMSFMQKQYKIDVGIMATDYET
jgi:hypothetical protein